MLAIQGVDGAQAVIEIVKCCGLGRPGLGKSVWTQMASSLPTQTLKEIYLLTREVQEGDPLFDIKSEVMFMLMTHRRCTDWMFLHADQEWIDTYAASYVEYSDKLSFFELFLCYGHVTAGLTKRHLRDSLNERVKTCLDQELLDLIFTVEPSKERDEVIMSALQTERTFDMLANLFFASSSQEVADSVWQSIVNKSLWIARGACPQDSANGEQIYSALSRWSRSRPAYAERITFLKGQLLLV